MQELIVMNHQFDLTFDKTPGGTAVLLLTKSVMAGVKASRKLYIKSVGLYGINLNLRMLCMAATTCHFAALRVHMRVVGTRGHLKSQRLCRVRWGNPALLPHEL
jgi:hypothetical protein